MDEILTKSELIDTIRASDAFITKIGKGTGWIPQPEDTRDFKLTQLIPTPTAAADLPPVVDLGPGQSPIRDQGQIGACTGFGTTAAVEYLRRKPGKGHAATLYSPLFVYYNARAALGEEEKDEGAIVRDAIKSLQDFGAAKERDWMYYEVYRTFCTKPTVRAYKSAESWKIGGYYSCNGLNDLRTALAHGFPVVGGFVCYDNMGSGDAMRTGIIPPPGNRVTGGHCVCFIGYDDTKRLVKFKNSWGSYWGDHGYGYLPYEFFEKGLADDLWVLEGKSA